MITKEIAIALRGRTVLHHVTKKNSDNTPMRVRVNGKCKTWVTRPNEFRLPVKYGLYECGYIDQDNAASFVVA